MSSRKSLTEVYGGEKPLEGPHAPEPASDRRSGTGSARREDAPRALDDMQLEVALYIESISAELRTMARETGLESLAYFLEMARIEASLQIERRALRLDSTGP